MSSKIESRILEILIKDMYGTYASLAVQFGVTEQYIGNLVKVGRMPISYASFLSRTFGIPAYLFNFHDFVLLCPITIKEYKDSICKHTSPLSQKYIFDLPLPDIKKLYKENDKKWTK